MEENILAMFGCPRKIIIDNAQAFRFSIMIDFYDSYNIILGHSTPYYPYGNGLYESSNKILMRLIKKLLPKNKKACDSRLKYALWVDK